MTNRSCLFLSFLILISSFSLLGEAKEEAYQKTVKVQPLLTTSVTAGDQPIVYPKSDHPEVRALLVEIPVGAQTGWHLHPVPCYAYLLSGTLEVEIEGGKKNRFTAGQALVETVNQKHNGRNIGKDPVKIVLFVMGEKDKPFTIK